MTAKRRRATWQVVDLIRDISVESQLAPDNLATNAPVVAPADAERTGGMAEASEPPADAVRRELREELGLEVRVGGLLCVDWVSPHGPWDDLISFIFDGDVLDEQAIASLRLVDDELRAYEFCDEDQVKQRLRPYVWRRVSVALEALTTGRAGYLEDGYAL
jgi:8-oxo-dGTP diphosphatase